VDEGSEGIDEGFLQVASADSCRSISQIDETKNNSSNQDEAAMFSFLPSHVSTLSEDTRAADLQLKANLAKQSVTQDQKRKSLHHLTRQF